MKYALLALILVSQSALAATAYFTGNQRHVTTVTGQFGTECEYRYLSNTFWRTFGAGGCPQTIEVQ